MKELSQRAMWRGGPKGSEGLLITHITVLLCVGSAIILIDNGFGTNLVRDMERKKSESGITTYHGNWCTRRDISDLVAFFGDVTLYQRYIDFLDACQWVEPLPRQSGQHRKWYPLKDLLGWVDITESQVTQLIELRVMLRKDNAVRFASPAKVLVRCREGVIVKKLSRNEKWKTDYSSPLYAAPICELADTTIASLDIPKWSIVHLCPYWGSLQCIQCAHPPTRDCSWECWNCEDHKECSCFRCDYLCEFCLDMDKCPASTRKQDD